MHHASHRDGSSAHQPPIGVLLASVHSPPVEEVGADVSLVAQVLHPVSPALVGLVQRVLDERPGAGAAGLVSACEEREADDVRHGFVFYAEFLLL